VLHDGNMTNFDRAEYHVLMIFQRNLNASSLVPEDQREATK